MPTHGALTKAGKVRSQTPKIDKTAIKRNESPIRRMRRNHRKRIINDQPVGRRRRR